MIFKWTSKNKTAAAASVEVSAAAEAPSSATTAGGEATPASSHEVSSHGAGQMARELLEKVVPFKTRASTSDGDLGDDAKRFLHEGGLGQEQAIETLRFGATIKGHDYNLVVGVPKGVDGTSLVRAVFKSALKREGMGDWAYVPCLEGSARWRALPLPPQRGLTFKSMLARALADLRDALPDVFASETYQLRRLAIDEMHGREVDGALIDLIHRAASKNVAVLRLPQGFSVAPMHEGKVVRPEVLSQLPDSMRREVEARVRGFQSDIEALLKRVPHLDRARRSELRELHEDVVAKAAGLALADVREAFADVPAAIARLDAIEKDLKAHAGRIVTSLQEGSDIWQRYEVLVVRIAERGGTPLVELHDVRPEALSGSVQGHPKGGALHGANGGTLLLAADALLHDPDAREVLIRAAASREITMLGDGPPADPIPFDAKVVLVGPPETCDRLFNVDPRLKSFFKIRVDLASAMTRTKETEVLFADAIQGLVTAHKTKPVDAAASQLLIEDASRVEGNDAQISLALGDTADLLREASTWAELAGDGAIETRHIARALKARQDRSAGSSHGGPVHAKVVKALGS